MKPARNVSENIALLSFESAEPTPDASGHVGFNDVLRFLRRRRWFMLAFVVGATAAMALIATSLPKLYAANAVLVFERNDVRLFENAADFESEQLDRSAIETEIDVLKTRLFVGKVVDEMGLIDDPGFNAYFADEGSGLGAIKDALTTRARSVLASVGLAEAPDSEPVMASEQTQRDRAISVFQDNMEFLSSGQSLAVTIRVRHSDPAQAAALANAVGRVYIGWSLDLKRAAAEEAYNFFQVRAANLDRSIAAREREIVDFAQENELVSDERYDIVRTEITKIGADVSAVRLDQAAAEAQLDHFLEMRARGAQAIDEGMTSPQLEALRHEMAVLERRRADLAVSFGPMHPEMQTVAAEIDRILKQIDDEVRRIVAGKRNEVDVLTRRILMLKADLALLDDELRSRSISEIRLRELENGLMFERRRFEKVVESLNTLDRQAEVLTPSARFLSEAEVPTEPAHPNVPVLVASASVGAAAIAAVVGLVLEGMDTRLRSATRVRQILSAPTLGFTPRLRRRWFGHRPSPIEAVAKNPQSTFAEAVRSIRRAAARVAAERPLQTLLVASCLPDEGAHVVACGVAAASAAEGWRTVLVDLDLARGQIDATIKVAADGPDVETCLWDVSQLDEALVPCPDVPNLDILPVAHPSARHRMVLGERSVETLISRLRERYDLIVVKAPPLLVSTDADLLGVLVDRMLLVVRWGRTREETLQEVAAQLVDAPLPLAGAVIAEVDERQHAAGRYGGRPQYRHVSARYRAR